MIVLWLFSVATIARIPGKRTNYTHIHIENASDAHIKPLSKTKYGQVVVCAQMSKEVDMVWTKRSAEELASDIKPILVDFN